MASDISLTAAMRANLLSLQQTSDLMSRTQTRLSTGKKINSAVDGPTAYFASQALTSRANKLDGLKDSMDQAISTIEGATKGIEAITELIEQAKGIATQIQSAGTDEALALGTQYDTLMTQLDELAGDSGYQGVNLLGGTSVALTVKFEGTNLIVTGFDASFSNGLGLTDVLTTSNAADQVTALDTALDELRTESSKLSSNLSIITTRMDFTQNLSNVLTDGADKLTLADTNEEGANMLMLQTRQSLGTTALSLASQSAQSVLQLFG
jgi:flagellin